MKKLFKTSLLAALLGWATVGFAGEPTAVKKEKVHGVELADMFTCSKDPAFRYLVETDRMIKANAASSADFWLADQINTELFGDFLIGMLEEHNFDHYDDKVEEAGCDEYAEYGYFLDNEEKEELDNLNLMGAGEFDWLEKPSPFSQLRQFEIAAVHYTGYYPFYQNKYLILDPKNQRRLSMQEFIALTPAAKALIRHAYRNELKRSSMYANTGEDWLAGFVDEQVNVIEIDYNDNMYFEKDGVVFWFSTSTAMFSESIYVKIPYKKINPYLKPQYRR